MHHVTKHFLCQVYDGKKQRSLTRPAIRAHKHLLDVRDLRRSHHPVFLASPHRSWRPSQSHLQRLARHSSPAGKSARALPRPAVVQHSVRPSSFIFCQALRLRSRPQNRRSNLRTNVFLGSIFLRRGRQRAPALASDSLHRHARVRLHLQHGLFQLLLVHGPRLFRTWLFCGSSLNAGTGWLQFLYLRSPPSPTPSARCGSLATLAYMAIRKKIRWPWRLILPAAIIAIFVAGHWYLENWSDFEFSWPERPFYVFNGLDQFVLYSVHYRFRRLRAPRNRHFLAGQRIFSAPRSTTLLKSFFSLCWSYISWLSA